MWLIIESLSAFQDQFTVKCFFFFQGPNFLSLKIPTNVMLWKLN